MVSYSDDSSLPDVTKEALFDALRSAKAYTVVILKKGPNFVPYDSFDDGVGKIVLDHGKRNYALHLAGLLPVVCPVRDESVISGIGIFDAGADDVLRIMAEDPGVKAGVFTFDIYPTQTFAGSTLR